MLVRVRKTGQVCDWQPTTDLICSCCRESLPVTHATLDEINFSFDFAIADALKRGEYWYLHRRCAWIEDALEVFWGWHPMRWVLGLDKHLQRLMGNLQKYLRRIMPTGIYDALYNAWLPALRPAQRAKSVRTLPRQATHQKVLKPRNVSSPALDISAVVPKAGTVYLLLAEGTPRIKIGRSVAAPLRLETLRTASPYPLALLRSITTKDCVRLERRLHKRYQQYRRHGEWFDLPTDVLTHLLEEDFD